MANSNSFTIDFAPFAAADRIAVTNNLNRPIKTLTDRATLDTVMELLRENAEGWEVPVDGVPVAGMRLNFYEGERILGNVGLDRAFLTVHTRGSFWSKATPVEVYDQLTDLLDLSLKNFKLR
jgi:hypothetical protein